jgi:collagenase-like PrtC family protease
MRTPYYVATVTDIYRKAIDGFYKGNFSITKDMLSKLQGAFSREFTEGWFSSSKDVFNRKTATGIISQTHEKEMYNIQYNKNLITQRKNVNFNPPEIKSYENKEKRLLVRVYNPEDAIKAANSGANIIYFDLFDKDFTKLKQNLKCKIYGITPRIMLDQDIDTITKLIKEKKPDGLLIGNIGLLQNNLELPIHIDYNCNCFNDLDVSYFSNHNSLPIISPELSLRDLKKFKDKRFIVMVHGKIRMMTLRHDFDKKQITDQKGAKFYINKIHNGSEIINEKEFGLLSKSKQLLDSGINNFFIDTDKNVSEIVSFYKKVLDNKHVDDSRIKKDYILGWAYRGVF